jgi:hypothetical protein
MANFQVDFISQKLKLLKNLKILMKIKCAYHQSRVYLSQEVGAGISQLA